MLLFEFFPLFVMLVGMAVGVWLFVIDRQVRRRSDDEAHSTPSTGARWQSVPRPKSRFGSR
jgi:hypothetical protein